MERAGGNRLKRKNVWQVLTCPRREPTTSPPKDGSERRRLSLRSENVTRPVVGATTTQSPSFLTEQQPGKENELPFALQQGSKRPTSIRTVTRIKKSWNPATSVTDSAKKVIKRRLSGDYEDQLSLNKYRRGNLNEPIIFPPRSGEPELIEAVANYRRDITPRFLIYDDQNNADTGARPQVREISAGGNVRSNDKMWATSEAESGRCPDISRDLPIPRSLHQVRRSYEMYNSKPEIAVETLTAAQGDNGPTDVLHSRSAESPEICTTEFRIERIDCSSYRPPAMYNRQKVNSGSAIGRLNIPLRKGDEISPFKRRMNQLRRSMRGGGIDKKVTAAAVAGGEYIVRSSKIALERMNEVKDLSTPKVPCLDKTKERGNRSAESTVDPSTGAIKKTSRFTVPEAREGPHSKPIPLAKSLSLSSVENDQQQQPNATAEPTPTNETDRVQVKVDKLIPSYCRPTLHDDLSELKDRFIEFLYDGVPGDSLQVGLPPTSEGAVFVLGTSKDRDCHEIWNAAFVKSENKFEPGHCNDLRIAPAAPGTRYRAMGKGQPIVKTGHGSGNITRGSIIGRISAEPTAAATPEFHSGDAPIRNPVSIRKKVQPRVRNQQVLDDRESRAKSTGNVCGPFHEAPSEISYTTDYTGESIEVEHARHGSCHKVSQSFLMGRTVTPGQRRIVVNFLISVHAYLLTSSSTLHQAVKMFDAILDVKDVSVKELQLVALGATWIAIKNMETKVPTASEMISFAKGMYNAEGPGLLCKCERKILKTLGFNIRFPDPCSISGCYLQQLWHSLGTMTNEPSIRRTVCHCAGYLLDVALLQENYSNTPSELLAAAATQTAARLVLGAAVSREYLADHSPWNNGKTTRHSYTQEEVERVAGPLIEGVLDSAEANSSTGAVYKKYKNVRYDNTGDYLVTAIKKLSDAAPTERNF